METPAAWTEKPAGFWIRVGAFFLDGTVFSLTNLPLFGLAFFAMRKDSGFDLVALWQWLPLVSLVLYVIYFSVMHAWKGQTFGKMLVGIKVQGPDGQNPGFLRSLGRVLAHYLSTVLFYLGHILAVFTGEKRALHDLICGTRVVRHRSIPMAGKILLVAMPIASIAILVSIAVPAFTAMSPRLSEKANRTALLHLRASLDKYYADHQAWPSGLDNTEFWNNYSKGLPSLSLPGQDGTNLVQNYRFTDDQGNLDPALFRFTGYWAYDPTFGKVIIDNQAKDSEGIPVHQW